MARALNDLESIQDRSARSLAFALSEAVRAQILGDPVAILRSQNTLARRLAKSRAVADLFGRRQLLDQLNRALGSLQFAVRDVDFLPSVPFEEAINAITRKRPILKRGWLEALSVYERSALTIANESTNVVFNHIQKAITQSIAKGLSAQVATNEIVKALGARQFDGPGLSFVKSYADTVFRTETTSAYALGRQAQAEDPEVRPFIGGWRYDATLDADVRPNHKAADNFMATIDDPVWKKLTPPLGYNCRCALSVITKREAKKSGLIRQDGSVVFRAVPAGAGPDAGFTVTSLSAVYR